jgi:hypothetical protein
METKNLEIKSFDVGSVVKIAFIIYAALGLIVGVVYVIVAFALAGLMEYAGGLGDTGVMRLAATGLGIFLIPVVALLYGCAGALAGLVVALIYNLVAKAVGGVRMTVDDHRLSSGSGSATNEVRL